MVKNIKTQTCTTTMKKFATFTASILLLPVFAACAPNDTAQVEPTPIVTAPPVADVTPEPTTPDATANENIPEVVQANPSLKTLGSLIDQAGLRDQLAGAGPYTLFAPSDQAFAAVPEETRQRLLQPENRELLRQVLTYHVVPGNLTADQLRSQELTTLANKPLKIQVEQGQVRVNDARVTQADIKARNGVIHIIDQVLLPPTTQQ